FSRALLVGWVATKVSWGTGADIVMESISQTTEWSVLRETLNKSRGQVLQPRFCVQRSPESMKILAESGRFPGGSRGPSTSWLLRFAYQPLRSGRQDGGAEHLIRVYLV